MPGKLNIELTEKQKIELLDVRDHDPKPYMRERAAAILKIASGYSGRDTALNRLNRPHWQDTVYEWVKRYQASGIEGLKIKPGRGRKPSFSPHISR
jgi:transposase